MKDKKQSQVFPYRERYLEHVVSLGENSDRYQTNLAELYIENLFKIQDREVKHEILVPDLINPTRNKLKAFLEEKSQYDPTALLEKVQNSWMVEEEIILLVKEKRYEQAINIFVQNGEYAKAELFCEQRPKLGLMTTLLKVYIDQFRFHWSQKS